MSTKIYDGAVLTLGQRAVACTDVAKASGLPKFRWMPGMLAVHAGWGAAGFRISEVHDDPRGFVSISRGCGFTKPDDATPDLDDPATLGCLLALVREAWGTPDAVTSYRKHFGWTCMVPRSGLCNITAETEAGCLVAALEAAPCRP